jgi:hypothetical protein
MIDEIFEVGFKLQFQFNYFEWLIGIITTFGIIYFLRAEVQVKEINIISNNNEVVRLKIPVINNSRFFAATNIIIEVALIKGNLTYHFLLDRNEFILIPKKCCCCPVPINVRTFQTMSFEETTVEMLDNDETYSTILNNLSEGSVVRVRIHANHEFTNFGKAFEFNFKYQNGNFTKL